MKKLTSTNKMILWVGILVQLLAIYTAEDLPAQAPFEFSENFDNFDPSRFHDIHCLLYAGAALLYAVKFTNYFQTGQ